MSRSEVTPRHFTDIDALIGLRRAEGRAVVFTEDTIAFLQDPAAVAFAESGKRNIKPADEVAGPLYLQHLRQAWRLQPVQALDFSGQELLPR